MISDPTMQLHLSSALLGPCFWTPAVGRRGGVAILCCEAFCDEDTDGRVLSLLIDIDDICINLVNVYVLMRPAE